MEHQEQETQQEFRSLAHMLKHTAKITEDETLTNAFSGGETRCITQFNKALARLRKLNAVPDGLFDELQAEASFSQIGIACHQLAAYLNKGADTTEDSKGWFASFFGEQAMS